jgi:His-Xaa-Ser system radical SAM maturase HxsB
MSSRERTYVANSNEILDFLKQNDAVVSTSLDGPAFIHNANRPRPGNNSYDLAIAGIRRVRAVLGHDKVSAIMTTTRLSLDHPEAIVDEYVAQGFNSVFLRPISPYGFAVRTRSRTGYELDLFLAFYKKALEHIIALNRGGIRIAESYAQLLLKKILTPFPTGYVDLQSPAGAGIGVAVYNYDGDVYPTDEARMLLEMGDRTFRLGNVHTNTYKEIFGGEVLRTLVAASCVESLPGCADCAFQIYCGCDPIENYAAQGNIFGQRPTSNFHKRNVEIIKHLLRLYHGGDTFVQQLFLSWVQNRNLTDLIPSVSGY